MYSPILEELGNSSRGKFRVTVRSTLVWDAKGGIGIAQFIYQAFGTNVGTFNFG